MARPRYAERRSHLGIDEAVRCPADAVLSGEQSRINHVANDDEACSAPVHLAEVQNRLFS